MDKKKEVRKNLKNTDDKCFQYVATTELNCEEIDWNPERVLKISLFINKHNWKGISLNTLYIKEKEICPDYISKIISDSEKQTIILMIPNEEKADDIILQ